MSTKTSEKVICTVCGAVLDASVRLCPVCGVGEEYFVPMSEDGAKAEKPATSEASPAVTARRGSERFVILGAGIAGIAAAEEIRRIHPTASIVMVSEETALPYYRTSLSKERPVPQVNERFAMRSPEWYSTQGIFILFGRRAVRVLTNQKQVELSDGEVLGYDKCIFATGARSVIPPMEGRTLQGVFTLRSITDLEAMARHMRPDMRAVVIGGGVLGLEAAWQLHRSGCHVTVLEAAEQLFPGRVAAVVANHLVRLAALQGIDIRTGVRVSRLEGEDYVRQVILPGEYLRAELVLLCCGNRPCIETAQEAGLEIDRGIMVNSRMMTGKYGVYACGDCAQIGQEVCGMWNTAETMGRCAGRNAAGEDAMYQPCPTPLMMDAFGSHFFAAGDCGMSDKKYRIERFGDADAGEGKYLYYSDGRLCGAVLVGDISQASALLRQIEAGKVLETV